MDIQQPIDSGLREIALFAGAGGGILGGKLLGWRTYAMLGGRKHLFYRDELLKHLNLKN